MQGYIARTNEGTSITATAVWFSRLKIPSGVSEERNSRTYYGTWSLELKSDSWRCSAGTANF
jgi:hypothetical protein